MAVDLNRENFEEEVVKSPQPVLVDFWGPQCRPCLALMPAVEKLEKHYGGKLKVAKINATENRMLCAKLRVISLPSFLLYKGGVEVARLTGDQITIKEIADKVESSIQ